MQHQPLIVRWSMPITIVLLVVMALAPITWTAWTQWFAAQIRVVIAPVAQPISIAIDTIIPPTTDSPEASQRERTIADELDRVRTELLQTRQENHRLTQLIDQFSRGAAITPELDVRQIRRPRISGLIGDQLLIRTDKIEGLTQGTVVVADAVQLLGRISRVDGRTSTVLPITAKSTPKILATVLLDAEGTKQVKCLLHAVGDGTLMGEVAQSTESDSWSVSAGQEVRLLDNQWPQHAQMLVIGTVERVERDEAQPLRRRIVVRPTVADLRRVPEVILRLPVTESDDRSSVPSGGQPGGGTGP